MEFFNDDLLDEIKSLESKPEIIEDFLSDEEVQQLVENIRIPFSNKNSE